MKKIIFTILILVMAISYTAGVCRGANSYLQFDGSTGYVDTGQTFQAVFQNETFSISVWIKLDEKQANTILSNYGDIGEYPGGFHLDAIGGISPSINFTYRKFNGLPTAIFTDSQVGVWLNIAVVWDRGEPLVSLYVNGVLKDSAEDVDTANNMWSEYTLLIGDDAGESQGYWHGSIDALRIYPSALTQAQITAIYANGRGTKYTAAAAEGGAAAYALNMDEGTGTTVTDAVSGTLQGTLIGGVTWQAGGVPFGSEMRGRYESGNQTGIRGRERY